MRLAVALRLGRVAAVPTVASNVLAAVALAGGQPRGSTIALACVAMVMMYVAGTFLNDAFDRDHDRERRRDRPIVRGEVTAAAVFDAGFGLLAGGIAVVATAALVGGAGWKPVVAAVALASLIVFYDARHRTSSLAQVALAACRVGVYATAALLVRPEIGPAVRLGCALLFAYLVGVAGVEADASADANASVGANVDEPPSLWPLAPLGAPLVILQPDDAFGIAIYAGFLLWTLRAVVLTRTRRVSAAASALVAGIALLDALACAVIGRPDLALACVGAFVATNVLQRIAPG